MSNKYLLLSTKSGDDLVELYRREHSDIIDHVKVAIDKEFYDAIAVIVAEHQTEEGVTYYELKELTSLIKIVVNELRELGLFDDVITSLLTVKFDKNLENYNTLLKIAEIVLSDRGFHNKNNAITYLERLMPVVRDPLLFLNIACILSKIQVKPLSKNTFDFLTKCVKAKRTGAEYKTQAGRAYREILCGMGLKDCETLQKEMKLSDSTDDILIPNREMFQTVIESSELPFSEQLIMFLLNYNFTFKVENNTVSILEYSGETLNTKVFKTAKKFEKRGESLIGASFSRTDLLVETAEPEEEKQSEKQKQKISLKFRHLYAEKKRYRATHIVVREDVTAEERFRNYENIINERNMKLERDQQFYRGKLDEIDQLVEVLEERLEEKREKEREQRLIREKEEKAAHEAAEKSKQWFNQEKSSTPKPFDDEKMNAVYAAAYGGSPATSNRGFGNSSPTGQTGGFGRPKTPYGGNRGFSGAQKTSPIDGMDQKIKDLYKAMDGPVSKPEEGSWGQSKASSTPRAPKSSGYAKSPITPKKQFKPEEKTAWWSKGDSKKD